MEKFFHVLPWFSCDPRAAVRRVAARHATTERVAALWAPRTHPLSRARALLFDRVAATSHFDSFFLPLSSATCVITCKSFCVFVGGGKSLRLLAFCFADELGRSRSGSVVIPPSERTDETSTRTTDYHFHGRGEPFQHQPLFTLSQYTECALLVFFPFYSTRKTERTAFFLCKPQNHRKMDLAITLQVSCDTTSRCAFR